MNKIKIQNKKHTAPSIWNEIDQDQLKTWVRICATQMSQEQGLRLATMMFYKIKQKKFFLLNSVQHAQLIDTIRFVCGKNKLTHWIIDKIRPQWKIWLGPSNRLATSTIKEFRFSEIYYNAYRKNGDEQFLNLLIATLYRPRDKDGEIDSRRKVTDPDIQMRAPKTRSLSIATRKAILFNYEGCRDYIFQKYPLIFQAKESSSRNDFPDLEGIIRIVAGGKFGSFQETQNTGLYLFLDHHHHELEELKKSK